MRYGCAAFGILSESTCTPAKAWLGLAGNGRIRGSRQAFQEKRFNLPLQGYLFDFQRTFLKRPFLKRLGFKYRSILAASLADVLPADADAGETLTDLRLGPR